jgi:hypothetical protein
VFNKPQAKAIPTTASLLAVLLVQVPLWEVFSVRLSILFIDRDLKLASLYDTAT